MYTDKYSEHPCINCIVLLPLCFIKKIHLIDTAIYCQQSGPPCQAASITHTCGSNKCLTIPIGLKNESILIQLLTTTKKIRNKCRYELT